MARRSLKEMKSAYKSNTESNDSRPNNYYPFYNMDFDSKATIRFLPDLNEENPLGFLMEKLTHTLTVNGEKKNVPCLKMYGEDECPICKQSAAFYKEDEEKGITGSVNGKRLYRRKQHLAQVLVVEDPLSYKEGQETAQNKVKLVNIGYSIYNKIKEAFEEDELEEVPDDYNEGTDFMIKKIKKGQWANYDNSKFMKRERTLTESEMAVVEGGLIDLATLLPKQPTLEFVQSMLDSDLNGTVFSDEEDEEKSASAEKTKSKPAAKTEPRENTTVSQAESSSGLPNDDADDEFDDDADAILADIRNRRKS